MATKNASTNIKRVKKILYVMEGHAALKKEVIEIIEKLEFRIKKLEVKLDEKDEDILMS